MVMRSRLSRRSQVRGRVPVFSYDLAEHLQATTSDVPAVVKICTEFVEKYGVTDGIYRLSGVTSNVNKLRVAFEKGTEPNLLAEPFVSDIHCVTSVCKQYFRLLPDPLLTYRLYSQFDEAVRETDIDLRLGRIRNAISQLPPPNYRTLLYLMRHLETMASHSVKTNMHVRNLAIVWAPNLLRSQEMEGGNVSAMAFLEVRVQSVVLETIIGHAATLFDGGPRSPLPCYESGTPPQHLLTLAEAQTTIVHKATADDLRCVDTLSERRRRGPVRVLSYLIARAGSLSNWRRARGVQLRDVRVTESTRQHHRFSQSMESLLQGGGEDAIRLCALTRSNSLLGTGPFLPSLAECQQMPTSATSLCKQKQDWDVSAETNEGNFSADVKATVENSLEAPMEKLVVAHEVSPATEADTATKMSLVEKTSPAQIVVTTQDMTPATDADTAAEIAPVNCMDGEEKIISPNETALVGKKAPTEVNASGDEIAPVHDIVSVDEILAAQEMVPVNKIILTDEMTPVDEIAAAQLIMISEESATAEIMAPVENMVPMQELASTQEMVLAEETSTAEEMTKPQKTVLIRETAPTEDASPAISMAGTKEVTSNEEMAVVQKIPQVKEGGYPEEIIFDEQIAVVAEIAPTKQTAPMETITPVKQKASVEKKTAAPEIAPTQKLSPVQVVALRQDEAPVQDEALVLDEGLFKNEAPVQDEALVLDVAPAQDVAQDVAPVVQDVSPVVQDMAPVEQDMAPVEQDMAPVEQDMAPVEQDVAPVVQDVAPVVQDVARVVQDVALVEQDVAPAQDVAQDVSPVVQDMAPVVQDVAPVVQDVALVEQDMAPVEQDVALVEQDVAPAQDVAQDVSLVVQDMAPVVQDVAPVVQDVAPVEQDVAAVEQDVVPVVQDVSLVEKVYPAQEVYPMQEVCLVQDEVPVQNESPVQNVALAHDLAQDVAPAQDVAQDVALAQDVFPVQHVALMQDVTQDVTQDVAPLVQEVALLQDVAPLWEQKICPLLVVPPMQVVAPVQITQTNETAPSFENDLTCDAYCDSKPSDEASESMIINYAQKDEQCSEESLNNSTRENQSFCQMQEVLTHQDCEDLHETMPPQVEEIGKVHLSTKATQAQESVPHGGDLIENRKKYSADEWTVTQHLFAVPYRPETEEGQSSSMDINQCSVDTSNKKILQEPSISVLSQDNIPELPSVYQEDSSCSDTPEHDMYGVSREQQSNLHEANARLGPLDTRKGLSNDESLSNNILLEQHEAFHVQTNKTGDQMYNEQFLPMSETQRCAESQARLRQSLSSSEFLTATCMFEKSCAGRKSKERIPFANKVERDLARPPRHTRPPTTLNTCTYRQTLDDQASFRQLKQPATQYLQSCVQEVDTKDTCGHARHKKQSKFAESHLANEIDSGEVPSVCEDELGKYSRIKFPIKKEECGCLQAHCVEGSSSEMKMCENVMAADEPQNLCIQEELQCAAANRSEEVKDYRPFNFNAAVAANLARIERKSPTVSMAMPNQMLGHEQQMTGHCSHLNVILQKLAVTSSKRPKRYVDPMRSSPKGHALASHPACENTCQTAPTEDEQYNSATKIQSSEQKHLCKVHGKDFHAIRQSRDVICSEGSVKDGKLDPELVFQHTTNSKPVELAHNKTNRKPECTPNHKSVKDPFSRERTNLRKELKISNQVEACPMLQPLPNIWIADSEKTSKLMTTSQPPDICCTSYQRPTTSLSTQQSPSKRSIGLDKGTTHSPIFVTMHYVPYRAVILHSKVVPVIRPQPQLAEPVP